MVKFRFLVNVIFGRRNPVPRLVLAIIVRRLIRPGEPEVSTKG